MRELNHEHFLKHLSERGFEVQVKAPKGTTDFELFLNDVRVPKNDYHTFGYFCRGQYAPCNRTTQKTFDRRDVLEAERVAARILTDEIRRLEKYPGVYEILQFLQKFGKTKIERDAAVRISTALEDAYQSGEISPPNEVNKDE